MRWSLLGTVLGATGSRDEVADFVAGASGLSCLQRRGVLRDLRFGQRKGNGLGNVAWTVDVEVPSVALEGFHGRRDDFGESLPWPRKWAGALPDVDGRSSSRGSGLGRCDARRMRASDRPQLRFFWGEPFEFKAWSAVAVGDF